MDLDAVPWRTLHGTHGNAADVPRHLGALGTADHRDALARLSDAIYHQGTRWQVSAHVLPFLVALIDNPDSPARGEVVALLQAVGVGDHELPFDPAVAFADGQGVTDEQVIHELYYADTPEPTELWDKVAVRWAADAYYAAAEHIHAYRRWLDDPDETVAAHAAALLAWFADEDGAELLTLPRSQVVQDSGNLALAYLGTNNDINNDINNRLRDRRTITAAIALAHRMGQDIPDHALDLLIDAEDLPDTPPGWPRSMRGYVALARQKLGL